MDGMNSAATVDEQIEIIKQKIIPLSDKVWELALLTVEWPYIFGDRGEYCTPSHRQARYNSVSPGTNRDNIKNRCKNFDGTGSCSGCKWFPGGMKVRAYDCRGFTYWCLLKFGIKINGAGCTSQWNDESNWDAKGTIDNIPEDKLVCLFYYNKSNPSVWEHTGLGYKGQTIECSNGVQHFGTRNKKWTHWALPKGIDGTPSPTLPTLRRGSSGEYVTLLQTKLIQLGYDLSPYGADGKFGAKTETAVKAFQKDHGLTADGICGPKTWEALETGKGTRFTVTIQHLSRTVAEELVTKYGGTMTAEEG